MPPKRKRTKKKIIPVRMQQTSEARDDDFEAEDNQMKLRLRAATKFFKKERPSSQSSQSKTTCTLRSSNSSNPLQKTLTSSGMKDNTPEHVDNNSNTSMGQINQIVSSDESDAVIEFCCLFRSFLSFECLRLFPFN